jgi:nucleoside triphosphate pyrophosphatase
MPKPPPKLILASSSPRRRELLAAAGYNFTIMPPDASVECGVCSERGPAGLVAELAYRKAAAIRTQLLEAASAVNDKSPKQESPCLPLSLSPGLPIILAADTIAECDGMILGKPRDEADARAMLQKLSGRKHRVLTGVCVWPISLPLPLGEGRGEGSPQSPEPLVRIAVSELRMDPLTAAQIDNYLATGGWEGKAGAFGYQDRLGWVHIDSGTESNVVGLPMDLVAELLAEVTRE